MQFDIKRTDFLKALQRVQGTAAKSDTMPVLANVLLKAEGDSLTAWASDLEIFTSAVCAAAIKEKGSVAVNARKLFEIVKDLPGDDVSVAAGKDSKVEIKAMRSRFKLSGIPAMDFPAIPEISTAGLERMDAEFLKDLFDRTFFAASTDETRYNIHGFLLDRGEGRTRMVATNGHMIVLIEKPGKDGERQSVLIPRKGALEMRKLLGEVEGEVGFGTTKKRATLQAGDTMISTRLLEGEFPDYERVIPQDHDRVILADKYALLNALKRVALLSPKDGHGVKMAIRAGALTLSSHCADIGEASEDIDIEYAGDEMEISCSADYLTQVIEAVPASRARLCLKEALSPILIHGEGSTEFTGVIMPMRL